MTNDKQLMTWSLRIQNADYRHDYEEYGNKITSIGLHEWDVDGSGKIAVYKLNPVKWNPDDDPNDSDKWGLYKDTYVDSKGVTQKGWEDATVYDRYLKNTWGNYSRPLFPVYIEPDMKRWPHIQYYMQFVIFGPETVTRILDSSTVQDTLISNMKKTVALFRKDKDGKDLGYYGIEMDIEGSFSDDKWDTRSGDDQKYINFLTRIKNEVIIDTNPDFKLRINAHAMWGDGVPDYFRFHNYKMFAESKDKNGKPLFDEVQIMSYDFSWSGSAPGPSTPIWWLENICAWVDECFNPAKNPKSIVPLKNVWIGGAGYGRRWPIYDADNYGSSVTYRNLVDWQNGYYTTYRNDKTQADQDFIPINSFNDPTSDNQIMYPHVYDYLRARHFIMPESQGQVTTRLSEYNSIEYATAYSKNQHVNITGLKGLTGLVGTSEPTTNVTDKNWKPLKRTETAIVNINGIDYEFQGYYTYKIPYVPDSTGTMCIKSSQPENIITYQVNVPTAGRYEIGAVVSFPFYKNTKLGGHINGSTQWQVGGDVTPDYYPMMFKASHIWNMGSFDFNAGTNTITVEGPLNDHGTIIFGFIIAEQLNVEVIGGYLNGSPNIKRFKKRDGSDAKLPNQLAFTNEVLQQAPRPAIMWEDFFRQYLGTWDGMTDPKTIDNSGLQSTTYYRNAGSKVAWGEGTTLGTNSKGNKDCYAMIDTGYSQGYWDVITDPDGTACAYFYPANTLNGGVTSGQLMLNYGFRITNISVQVQFKVKSGDRAGIRFASNGPGDGYLFYIDYKKQTINVVYENTGLVVASRPLGDREVAYGDRLTLEMVINGGKGRFTIGGVNLFPEVTLTLANMKAGAMGFYSTNAEVYLYMMSLRTTERWETLERFQLILDGVPSAVMGELNRPGITRDEYGYLNYSGLNEINTRADGQTISLDYVFKTLYFPTAEGKRNVQIKLIDAGLWYKQLYIGDAEGMSITYAGDTESFNKAMNIAVYDYGCKGIGLWVLGQGDPRIYETLPDVVPWHE